MRIERFDPEHDTATVRALYRVYADGAPLDDPAGPAMAAQTFAGWLAHGWTGVPRETWLASSGDGSVSGGYLLELPDRENKDRARLSIWVSPPRRRAGLGTALLRHAAGRARADGRSSLDGETREGSPGDAFARAAGGSPGLSEIRRILDVGAIPDGQLDRHRAAIKQASAGYSLASWEGSCPERLAAQLVALYEAMADAPHGPGEEPERWDVGRVRSVERGRAAQGLRHYSMAARHDATGALAGLTEVGVEPDQPEWGHQELTAVARPHRGHRLGLMVKVAMLDLLARREPQIERIVTWNGESNRHMIAINETLGYRIADRWTTSWLLPVDPVSGAG
ncbi:MAG TPA: GNAT family N-acetyltransferase [Streptosporangiaceae bacterium]|nr:GNAT family N-acetyltransferase [Streptosporangiaceae bacterium]